MKKVLVFPCGSEIGLEVQRSLSKSTHFQVIGASSVDDHGKYAYDEYISGLPFISDQEFIIALNRLIKEINIDYIIPAHDDVITKLSENQALINAEVVTSPSETCLLCRSKSATYERLSSIIRTPQVYNNVALMRYPVFMKPDIGQGAKGAQIINNENELHFFREKNKNLLVLEYLPGNEYTVDCFTDRYGKLRYNSSRMRNRISNGISVNTCTVKNNHLEQLANKINNNLVLRGAWFFQAKESVTGELTLLEIAPRIAGASAHSRVNGVNLSELSLFDRMGIDVEILSNGLHIEIDRALCSKAKIEYDFNHVYVDLDDTLILNGQVNHEMIAFIYKMHSMGKKIHLITKHDANARETLKTLKICPEIFDEIRKIDREDDKAKYILHFPSIFIDDSFSERKNIYKKLNIPVFSANSIDFFL